MRSCAPAAQTGATTSATASAPSINRMAEPSLRQTATGSTLCGRVGAATVIGDQIFSSPG